MRRCLGGNGRLDALRLVESLTNLAFGLGDLRLGNMTLPADLSSICTRTAFAPDGSPPGVQIERQAGVKKRTSSYCAPDVLPVIGLNLRYARPYCLSVGFSSDFLAVGAALALGFQKSGSALIHSSET